MDLKLVSINNTDGAKELCTSNERNVSCTIIRNYMCSKNVKEKLETYDHTTKDECNKSAFNFHFISLKIPQFLEKHKILKILNLLKMYKTFQTRKTKWLILLIKKVSYPS